ncbi:MAG: hypothetical protein A2Y73_01590 [Chloroflexi bacterium RBG_13_56_8]|nr:MAG: hypothetical protein A2Y73_01590 [Chloroflexi bacterium RBG_13_56_8]
MKVLALLTYYYPHWTGLTAYAQRLSEGLAARGHHVTVLTSRFQQDLAPEDEHHGVHIRRLRPWLRLSRGQVMPSLPFALYRLVREHDVVQVHAPCLEVALAGALAHQAGRKMLMTHHGDLVMPGGWRDQFVQKAVGFLLDQGADSADMISIHSRDYADHSDYLHPYRDKVVAIYPPVEIPPPDIQAVAAWREELGLNHAKLVGFAGRFVEEKGFDYLLKAIPLIKERMPEVKFVFAGEPKVVYENFFERCRPLLEAHQEQLVMLGLIKDPQKLANFYAMCDVFALPSRTDCFPSVQIEAMLCGTPVVATSIPGAREVVTVTGMGRLVEPCSEESLADGLLEVLSHRESYVKPYQHIRHIFDTEETISAYERLLQSLL